jgi:hypothetical protein
LGSSREDLGCPDLGVDADPGGTDGGQELRNDPALENACGKQAVSTTYFDASGESAVDEHARDVGDEHDPVGLETHRESTRSLVCIHVQGADGDGRDHRYASRSERFLDRCRPARERIAHEAQLGKRARLEPDVVAGEGQCSRAEGGGQLGPDGKQRLAYDREGRSARHAAAAHELDWYSASPKLGADLRPGAVNDDDLLARTDEAQGSRCRDGGNASAELDYDATHVVYSAFSRT